MAPIRRYLRITKYSVLECRIYLDNPALAQSWLLHPRDPVLPRVIASVRPLVLPKLREEKERERSKKKGKKRSIKDVVVEDDFEVSIFLTETDTRHSLLHKQKLFRDKLQTRLTSNSSRLVGASREAPIDVGEGGDEEQYAPAEHGTADDVDDVPILREEEEGGGDHDIINLADIPGIDVDETAADSEPTNRRRSKRRRSGTTGSDAEVIDSDAGESEPFVGSSGSESASDVADDDEAEGPPPPKRRRRGRGGDEEAAAAAGDTTAAAAAAAGTGHDDKKKMAMDISYEGFAIYGRVLCLVVKRRGDGRGSGRAGGGVSSAAAGPSSGGNLPQTAGGRPGGQAMMENWIASTQLPEADVDVDAGDAADAL